MNERIIFHVDMNAFFAAIEQRMHPVLRGQPIAVCGNPKSRTVVAACSYEAKACGITNGMSIMEARGLCPQLITVGGDPHKYMDVARRIFAILADFTTQLEIFSIDEAFLDMTHTFHHFGDSPEAAARTIKARIRAECFGLTCSVGIGPNKLIAKLESDLHKPDGLVRILEAHVPALLEQLPVSSLCGVGPRLQVVLNDLGIVTCADLGRAPGRLLVARFGVIGRCLKRMGQGRDESPVLAQGAESLVKSMGHAYTLPRDTPSRDEMFGTLLRLCEQVGRRLRADGYQGRTIGLTIRYRDFSTIVRHRTTCFPTDSGPVIFGLAMQLFEEHCEPLAQRVRLVGVAVSELIHRQRQLSFLEADQALERLDRCLDQINDRFGECTVVRASAVTPLIATSHGFLIKSSPRHRGLVLG